MAHADHLNSWISTDKGRRTELRAPPFLPRLLTIVQVLLSRVMLPHKQWLLSGQRDATALASKRSARTCPCNIFISPSAKPPTIMELSWPISPLRNGLAAHATVQRTIGPTSEAMFSRSRLGSTIGNDIGLVRLKDSAIV
jgi:hypothetical protein